MLHSGKLLAASIFLAGCTTSGVPSAGDPLPSPASDDYGLTRTRPIEVCRPDGERQYLARLICPSDEHPDFERVGNVGPPIPDDMSQAAQEKMLRGNMAMTPLAAGEPDHRWIDAYEVRCGAQTTTIYMDMYHCSAVRPSHAPAGFAIAP